MSDEKFELTEDTLVELVGTLNESLEKSVQEDKSRRFRILFRKWAKKHEVPFITLRGHGYVVSADGGENDLLIFENEGKVTLTPYEPTVEEEEEEEDEE